MFSKEARNCVLLNQQQIFMLSHYWRGLVETSFLGVEVGKGNAGDDDRAVFLFWGVSGDTLLQMGGGFGDKYAKLILRGSGGRVVTVGFGKVDFWG